MLSLYRRHLSDCPHRTDRLYRRCTCPVWIMGTDPRGKFHRHTLHTNSWTAAEEQRRKIEVGESDKPRIEIDAALDAWLAALRAAKRKERTIEQVHGAMARRLSEWCKDQGYVHLDKLDLATIDRHISSWNYASTTHRARIRLLRSFLKFCVARKWIAENPAVGVLMPEQAQEPTLPFTVEEERRLFDAALRFGDRRHFNGLWSKHPATARALMLVMRWTGLRVSDAVMFEPFRIEAVKIDSRFLPVYQTCQTKTGQPVLCPIPPAVAKEILDAPRLSDHAFIPPPESGLKTDPRSVANSYYDSYLVPLGKLAGVAGVHAHRWRDTFSVRLLEAGKPLEIVQQLLGHKSIKTTEQAYAPWVLSRQQMLIREVSSLWHSSPVEHPAINAV